MSTPDKELREILFGKNNDRLLYPEDDDVDEIIGKLKAYGDERERLGKISALDHVIDLQDKQFNRWTQMDIANFFNGVGRYYRELQKGNK